MHAISISISQGLSNLSAIISPTSTNAFSLKPLVVKALVPILIPPGEIADLSPKTAFLFKEISTFSHIFSILEPVIPKGFKTSCNPNILARISAQNFQYKYPFSTILFLFWLHKIVIPHDNFIKSILLHADAVWLKMQQYPKNTENWSEILSNFDWDYLIDFANSKIIEEVFDQKLYPYLIEMGAVSGKSKLQSKQRNIHSKEYKFNPDWDEDVILSLLNLFANNFKWTPPKIPIIQKCITGQRNKIPLSTVKKVGISKILTEHSVFSYAIPSPKIFNFTSFETVKKSPIND